MKYPKRRKSPIRHRVKAHVREGRSVKSFERGKGVRQATLRKRMKVYSVKPKKYHDFTGESYDDVGKSRNLTLKIEKRLRPHLWLVRINGYPETLTTTEINDLIHRRKDYEKDVISRTVKPSKTIVLRNFKKGERVQITTTKGETFDGYIRRFMRDGIRVSRTPKRGITSFFPYDEIKNIDRTIVPTKKSDSEKISPIKSYSKRIERLRNDSFKTERQPKVASELRKIAKAIRGKGIKAKLWKREVDVADFLESSADAFDKGLDREGRTNLNVSVLPALRKYEAKKVPKFSSKVQLWRGNVMMGLIDRKAAIEMIQKGRAKRINEQAIYTEPRK